MRYGIIIFSLRRYRYGIFTKQYRYRKNEHPKETRMKLIQCECCGGNQFQKNTSNSMICRFCGSIYRLDENEIIMSKEITDAKVMSLFLDAEKCRKTNNHIDEIQYLIKALELDENRAIVWVKLGRAYRESNLLDKAIDCYEKAIEIDPNYPQSYTNLGAVYLVKKEYEKAIRFYEKGLPLFEKNDIDYPTVLANYGLAIAMTGDKKKAAELINRAEKMGYAYASNARKAAGLSFFSKFI